MKLQKFKKNLPYLTNYFFYKDSQNLKTFNSYRFLAKNNSKHFFRISSFFIDQIFGKKKKFSFFFFESGLKFETYFFDEYFNSKNKISDLDISNSYCYVDVLKLLNNYEPYINVKTNIKLINVDLELFEFFYQNSFNYYLHKLLFYFNLKNKTHKQNILYIYKHYFIGHNYIINSFPLKSCSYSENLEKLKYNQFFINFSIIIKKFRLIFFKHNKNLFKQTRFLKRKSRICLFLKTKKKKRWRFYKRLIKIAKFGRNKKKSYPFNKKLSFLRYRRFFFRYKRSTPYRFFFKAFGILKCRQGYFKYNKNPNYLNSRYSANYVSPDNTETTKTILCHPKIKVKKKKNRLTKKIKLKIESRKKNRKNIFDHKESFFKKIGPKFKVRIPGNLRISPSFRNLGFYKAYLRYEYKKQNYIIKNKFYYYLTKYNYTFLLYNLNFFQSLFFFNEIKCQNLAQLCVKYNFSNKLLENKKLCLFFFKYVVFEHKQYIKFFNFFRKKTFYRSGHEKQLIKLFSTSFHLSIFFFKLFWFKNFFFNSYHFNLYCFFFFKLILKNNVEIFIQNYLRFNSYLDFTKISYKWNSFDLFQTTIKHVKSLDTSLTTFKYLYNRELTNYNYYTLFFSFLSLNDNNNYNTFYLTSDFSKFLFIGNIKKFRFINNSFINDFKKLPKIFQARRYNLEYENNLGYSTDIENLGKLEFKFLFENKRRQLLKKELTDYFYINFNSEVKRKNDLFIKHIRKNIENVRKDFYISKKNFLNSRKLPLISFGNLLNSNSIYSFSNFKKFDKILNIEKLKKKMGGSNLFILKGFQNQLLLDNFLKKQDLAITDKNFLLNMQKKLKSFLNLPNKIKYLSRNSYLKKKNDPNGNFQKNLLNITKSRIIPIRSKDKKKISFKLLKKKNFLNFINSKSYNKVDTVLENSISSNFVKKDLRFYLRLHKVFLKRYSESLKLEVHRINNIAKFNSSSNVFFLRTVPFLRRKEKEELVDTYLNNDLYINNLIDNFVNIPVYISQNRDINFLLSQKKIKNKTTKLIGEFLTPPNYTYGYNNLNFQNIINNRDFAHHIQAFKFRNQFLNYKFLIPVDNSQNEVSLFYGYNFYDLDEKQKKPKRLYNIEPNFQFEHCLNYLKTSKHLGEFIKETYDDKSLEYSKLSFFSNFDENETYRMPGYFSSKKRLVKNYLQLNRYYKGNVKFNNHISSNSQTHPGYFMGDSIYKSDYLQYRNNFKLNRKFFLPHKSTFKKFKKRRKKTLIKSKYKFRKFSEFFFFQKSKSRKLRRNFYHFRDSSLFNKSKYFFSYLNNNFNDIKFNISTFYRRKKYRSSYNNLFFFHIICKWLKFRNVLSVNYLFCNKNWINFNFKQKITVKYFQI